MRGSTDCRKPAPIVEAACWAHGRRKFLDLARINKAPTAVEAVERIDLLLAIEREINGTTPQQRVRARHERSRPLVTELESWLREQRGRVLKEQRGRQGNQLQPQRWTALTRFLDDGRLCMSNNAAERVLRAVAVGPRNWTFAGSDEGGRRQQRFTRSSRRGDNCPALRAAIGAGEQIVLAAERDRPDGSFDSVIIKFDAAVIEKQARAVQRASAYRISATPPRGGSRLNSASSQVFNAVISVSDLARRTLVRASVV
jgi:hypothetical protein